MSSVVLSPSAAGRWRALGEVVVATALAVLATRATGVEPRTIGLLALAAVTPALADRDFRERRLPNRLVVTALGAGLVAMLAQWWVTAVPPVLPLVSAAAYFAFLLLLALTGGMGMGDVKLGAALGLAAGLVGPTTAIASPLLAFLSGGVVGVVALVRRQRSIPFGPVMLAGFWGAVALSLLLTVDAG